MILTSAEQTHRDLLEKWRHAMDLVGPGPLAPHFEDAARAVSWLEAAPLEAAPLEAAPLEARGDWADLGSGAGFPGVALAARHPYARVTLVESRQKRATFLKEVVYRATLSNARVFHGRSEALEDGSLDGVISRAYRPPADYLADALRLLRPGGTAVLLLARQDPPVFHALEVFHVEHYEVDGKARQAVGYRKV